MSVLAAERNVVRLLVNVICLIWEEVTKLLSSQKDSMYESFCELSFAEVTFHDFCYILPKILGNSFVYSFIADDCEYL